MKVLLFLSIIVTTSHAFSPSLDEQCLKALYSSSLSFPLVVASDNSGPADDFKVELLVKCNKQGKVQGLEAILTFLEDDFEDADPVKGKVTEIEAIYNYKYGRGLKWKADFGALGKTEMKSFVMKHANMPSGALNNETKIFSKVIIPGSENVENYLVQILNVISCNKNF